MLVGSVISRRLLCCISTWPRPRPAGGSAEPCWVCLVIRTPTRLKLLLQLVSCEEVYSTRANEVLSLCCIFTVLCLCVKQNEFLYAKVCQSRNIPSHSQVHPNSHQLSHGSLSVALSVSFRLCDAHAAHSVMVCLSSGSEFEVNPTLVALVVVVLV